MDYQPPRGAIWAAEFFAVGLDLVGSAVDKLKGLVHWIGSDVKPLDQCKTADDVIALANSIRHKDPSFAADLFAAAGRDST